MARQVIVLVLFDIACLLGALAFVRRGFGPEALALAALVLGLGSPWSYLWTGGCFGRHLWLLFAAAGPALLARGRPAAAGAAIGAAVSLKLFPALLLAGPLLALFRPRPDRETVRGLLRFAAGGAGALLLLAAVSAVVLGPAVFGEFAGSIIALQTAPKGNDMGLPVLISAWLGIAPGGLAEVAISASLLLGSLAAWALLSRRLPPPLPVVLAPLVLLLATRFLGYYGVFLVLLAPACRGSPTRSASLAAAVLAGLVPDLLGWAGPPSARFQTAALIIGGAAVAISLWRRGDEETAR